MKTLNGKSQLTRAACAPLAFAVATFGALTFNAPAQTNSDTSSPSKVFSQTNHIKATVEDIDYDNRKVTLKGPEGNEVQFKVSDDVKNFPQVKKGDVVNIGYYESVALALGKPGEAVPDSGSSGILATRSPGQKPGGVGVNVTEISATVEDVDRDSREVTLKGPEGRTVKVLVDPSVGDLSRIKKGDQINIRLTQALAISVDKSDSNSGPTGQEPK
jgi:Cu/Ag efflux protein CusF